MSATFPRPYAIKQGPWIYYYTEQQLLDVLRRLLSDSPPELRDTAYNARIPAPVLDLDRHEEHDIAEALACIFGATEITTGVVGEHDHNEFPEDQE